jgi:hypothetical protein
MNIFVDIAMCSNTLLELITRFVCRIYFQAEFIVGRMVVL